MSAPGNGAGDHFCAGAEVTPVARMDHRTALIPDERAAREADHTEAEALHEVAFILFRRRATPRDTYAALNRCVERVTSRLLSQGDERWEYHRCDARNRQSSGPHFLS
jgi:hypothetical protein